jgi:hypothetical protein
MRKKNMRREKVKKKRKMLSKTEQEQRDKE